MDIVEHKSFVEIQNREKLTKLFNNSLIPNDEILENLGLFINSQTLSRILFFYEIYMRIKNSQGMIFEFGTRWGNIASTLISLRSIFEPFNRTRKIVCFDTFSGFEGIDKKDKYESNKQFSVVENYEKQLNDILTAQEAHNPINHIKKFDIIKGDITKTLPKYFDDHQEVLIALAIFDLDLYKPTKYALSRIIKHMHKGSIIVFDDLCDDIFPGETQALKDIFKVNEIDIKRMPITSRLSYIEL